MKQYHVIDSIIFKNDKMYMTVDGKENTFNLSDISERLEKASKIEREKYEVSPSGYGIHWPLIDEDLSIDGLLGIKHVPKKTKEFSNKTAVLDGN